VQSPAAEVPNFAREANRSNLDATEVEGDRRRGFHAGASRQPVKKYLAHRHTLRPVSAFKGAAWTLPN
jgi:hypothetical protein